jgi:PAS domain S-box-containing protein
MSIERYALAVSARGEAESAPAVQGAAAELESLRSSIGTMVHELALREERFRSIYDSVHDAILIIDAEAMRLIDVNAGMCEMFGYTRDEATQLRAGSLSSGMPPYTPENARSILLGASSRSQLAEWQMRHRDGHAFWVEVDVRAAMIGGERRVVTVMRDITARKEVEEALRRSERMSIMGALVGGVAHEVRNPLFGIAAALDAFEAEFERERDKDEYVRALRSDVGRLNRLMQDLLDFGRPQEAARHAQSIRPVLDEAVRICAPRAKEKQIEIRQQIGDELPPAAINADRMLLVFKNVVENAIEFSPAGTAVTIAVDNAQPSLVLSIADRGPGFNPEDVPHVFEPFYTRRRGGSGLGLAIAQKIVSEHEGTITAMNGAEGGGKIEIRLPAA